MNADDPTPTCSPTGGADGPGGSTPPAGTSIVVNGRSLPFAGKTVNRHQLARLAFPTASAAEEQALTIAYVGGPAHAPSGLLGHGSSLEVQDGQSFSVARTTKS